MDKVDKLYEYYEILANAEDKVKEHETEYQQILQAVKGERREKVLACQFIPRFFKDFPHLAEVSLDAQLDLVEDEDIAIRKQAIKHLPSICKDNRVYVSKIADILGQMLVCEDVSELAIVNLSLVSVLKLDVKGALAGLFSQIKTAEEEIVRKRAIGFICNQLKSLPADMVTKDIEEYILQECKEFIRKVSGEEFSTLMSMLANLRAAKTVQGQQALMDVIMGQVDLEKEFNYENTEDIICLLQCIRSALPFFSVFVSSTPFVKYISQQILPVLKNLSALVDEVDISLEITKLLAEVSPFYSTVDDDDVCLQKIYDSMIEFMPLPPTDNLESEALTDEPNFQFTHIECLMYAFHQLAKKNASFLTNDKNVARFKDFKLRLNFLARSIQSCIKTIKESLTDEKNKAAKPEDHKLKAVALRTMTNINALIKDMFHNPPSFKTSVALSWKPTSLKRSSDANPLKRKEITMEEGPKPPKKDWKGSRQLYTPPSGKYSGGMKKFYPSPGSGYRGRGRGGGQRFY